MKDIPKIRVFFLAFAFLSVGCSHYSTTGGALPSYLKTVFVPPFENEEDQLVIPGIEYELADAVASALAADNTLRVVNSEEADSILGGKIVRIVESPFTYNANEEVEEWRIRVSVIASLRDQKKRKDIWSEERIEGWGVYGSTTGSPEERQEGLDSALEMIAEEIVEKTVAGW